MPKAALVPYQGNKAKLADHIAVTMLDGAAPDEHFVDGCCGTGSVALALIAAGVAPDRICTMIL